MMRSAVERGEAKPLSEILQIASAAHPGEVVGVEFEAKGKSWVYEIKVADKAGRLVELHISAANSSVLLAGDLSLDERLMRVKLAGVPMDLAPLEYRALAYLMHNQGRIVSQTELSEHIHGSDDAYNPRTQSRR